MNGLEALAAIRAGATQAKPYLPVIMLTGDTDRTNWRLLQN
jgi:CheY-like chemotaxis protein